MADEVPVPEGIKDVRFEAFAELVETRFSALDLTVLLVYIIDHVHASALPHLAWQFHIMGYEGWTLAETETQKRTLLKQALNLHRFKGTPWAIETALASVGLLGTVVEWFDYAPTEGDPGHFKVVIDGSGIAQGTIDLIQALVEAWKRKSQYLDTIEFMAPALTATVYWGASTVKHQTIKLAYEEGT